MTGLSELQYGVLVVVSNIAAVLSCLGSSTICWSAWKKRKAVYHRMLFSLSLCDCLGSLGMAMHPWMIPKGTPRLYWGLGNKASCTAAGFFFVSFLLLVSFYSAFLGTNFLFTVRYRWTEEKIHKRLEIPGHIVAIAVSAFAGISGWAADTFEPTTFINVCWIGNCSINYLNQYRECPQEEINYGWIVGWLIVLMLVVNTSIAITCTVLLYRTIRSQYQTNHRLAFGGTGNEQVARREKEVAYQTICYSFAYFNSFFWVFLGGVFLSFDVWLLENEGHPGLYATQLLTWTFQPSQGLVNFMVYTRPTYVQWRRLFPEQSRIWALWKASALVPPTAQMRIDSKSKTTTSTQISSSNLLGASFTSLMASSWRKSSRKGETFVNNVDGDRDLGDNEEEAVCEA